MSYRVHLERDFCIGSGDCIHEAPDLFLLDEEGKVAFLEDADPDKIGKAALMKAAESCPVAAIHLFNEAGEQVFPYYL